MHFLYEVQVVVAGSSVCAEAHGKTERVHFLYGSKAAAQLHVAGGVVYGGDVMGFEYLTEMPDLSMPKIAKVKKFELEPMTELDAEAQMEALGHTFFVFLNAKTGLVSVLYKRNDNNLGMIEINY